MKKALLFFTVSCSIAFAMEIDSGINKPLVQLRSLAEEGSYAAAAILAQDAYEQKQLKVWLQANENLWPKLQSTNEMALAADWLSKDCCDELSTIQEESRAAWRTKLTPSTGGVFLAKKLLLCQELGICLRKLKNYESAQQVLEDISDVKVHADEDSEYAFRKDVGDLTNIVYALAHQQKNEKVTHQSMLQAEQQKNRVRQFIELRVNLRKMRQEQEEGYRAIRYVAALKRKIALECALAQFEEVEQMCNKSIGNEKSS